MYSSWNFCILVLSQILRCNLHKYILNREPREFEFTRFLVDGSHWVGKSDPCNRILQWSGAFIEISQYSTCSEDTRRWKRPVHQVEGVISVAVKVKQSKYKFHFIHMNIKSCYAARCKSSIHQLNHWSKKDMTFRLQLQPVPKQWLEMGLARYLHKKIRCVWDIVFFYDFP